MVAALLGALVTWLVLGAGVGREEFASQVPRAPVTGVPTGLGPPGPPGPRVTGPRVTGASASIPGRTRSNRSLAPRELRIPAASLRMPIRAAGVDRDGAMALPASAARLAWYRFGPGPWADRGAAVLAGHVDTEEEGPGPLVAVAGLRRGDHLGIRSGRMERRYVVTSVVRVAKPALDLPALFSRTGPPRVHLVTCGGRYLPDRGGYQDNVVVTARALDRR